MKKNRLAALLLGCVLGITAAVPAMAAGKVSAVYLSLVADDELMGLSPGESLDYTTPIEAWGDYYIEDTNITHSATSDVLIYTMDVYSANGSYFGSDTMVSVYGAYDISVVVRTSTRMRVTARAYPFTVLGEVSGIAIDTAGKKATWDPVANARSYSVIIYYTDSRGNSHRTRKSVKGTSVDLASYLDRYENVDVAVRPEKGSGTRDKYSAVPNYVNSRGTADDEYYVDVYEFHLPTAAYGWLADGSIGTNPFSPDGSSANNSGGSSLGPAGGYYPGTGPLSGPTGTPQSSGPYTGNGPLGSSGPLGGSPYTGSSPTPAGWQGSGNTWYYIVNGVRATGWLSISSEEWYFLDSSGLMRAGWYNDGSEVYLLNTNHDGTYGKMLTGYQAYNGYLYYFNQVHDGTYGAMYRNRYTPDGRWADGTGVVR